MLYEVSHSPANWFRSRMAFCFLCNFRMEKFKFACPCEHDQKSVNLQAFGIHFMCHLSISHTHAKLEVLMQDLIITQIVAFDFKGGF